MICRTGLLLLSSPLPYVCKKFDHLLRISARHVEKTLYVHFEPGLATVPVARCQGHPPKNNSETRKVMYSLYGQSLCMCDYLDVRMLLADVKKYQRSWSLSNSCDVILTDYPHYSDDNFVEYLTQKFTKGQKVKIVPVDLSGPEDHPDSSSKDVCDNTDSSVSPSEKVYNHTVMGGTFDRLHVGHKILLTEACLRTQSSLTIGVTDGPMLLKKVLRELIQPYDVRVKELRAFLEDVDPTLRYNLERLTDPFGPSTVMPELECIVTSEETSKGGARVNEVRRSKGLSELAHHNISMVSKDGPVEDSALSSSVQRKHLLGTLISSPKDNLEVPKRPYVIGLTGGIASGKSEIGRRMVNLGAAFINCDKLGHKSYEQNHPAYRKILEHFGADVTNNSGDIDRGRLAAKVFGNKAEMDKLNSIVWPEIEKLAKQEIAKLGSSGYEIVVLDAALLIEAGWMSFSHEVWVTFVPKYEAVRRVMERDGLSEEEAELRLNAQMSNEDRIKAANVVFCSLWEYETTTKQVEKAWESLRKRMSSQRV